jgi:hypothetical protein
MKRVVNLWLALLAAFWLTRAGISSLLFGRVEQGFRALVELLAVPALQAVALAWATRQGRQPSRLAAVQCALPWREAWRLRSFRVALAIDAGVLAFAWGPASASAAGLPAWVLEAKLLAGAALLLAALGRPGWSARDRLAVAAAAVALLALAAEPWHPWLTALPGLLAPLAPGAAATARAARWFGAYGLALGAALLLALEAAAALRRRGRAAALAFDQALCLLLAAAACATLGFLRQPAADAAWTRAAATLGSLCATALLVGSALAFRGYPAPAVAAESAAAAETPAGYGPPPPYRRSRRRLHPRGGSADDPASPPPAPGPSPGPGAAGGPTGEPA